MALARRRFSAGRRFSYRRPKQRGVWTGFGVVGTTLTANTTASWYLWDDISSTRLNLPGKGVHARTLLWYTVLPIGAGNNPTMGVTLAKYPSDANGNVPTALIINPMGWDGTTYNFTNLFEHDLMFYDLRRYFSGGTSTAYTDQSQHFDIRAKRKLDDTDGLLLSFSANGSVSLTFATRTYITY